MAMIARGIIVKKTITILLLVFSLSFLVYADNSNTTNTKQIFSDVTAEHWAKEAIDKVYAKKIIFGYPNGEFKPDNLVTRSEFIAMVNRMMAYKEANQTTEFVDVKPTDWFYKDLLIAEKAGYIKGFEDKTFRANDNISKEQVCAILVRITNLKALPNAPKPADKIAAWSEPSMMIMLSNRMISLDQQGKLNPTVLVSRAFVADIMSKFVLDEQGTEIEKESETNQPEMPPSSSDNNQTGSSGTKPEEETTTAENNDEHAVTKEKCEEVANTLEAVISEFKTESERDIIRMIIQNLNAYAADPNYDYKSAAERARDKYSNLSSEEKDDLMNVITKYCDTSTLIFLKDKLF